MDADHPPMIAEIGQVEPAPRRVRAELGGQVVLDTVRALYVWDKPYYPQYHVPLADLVPGVLVDEHAPWETELGTARSHGLQAGGQRRAGAAGVFGPDTGPLAGTVRFRWEALDAWFEEDEEIFVHPRNPYVRVDALRSTRSVQVALEGVTLAESTSTVMVFETGLPTRYYFDRVDVRLDRLVPSSTETRCPYKGTTSAYWSIAVEGATLPDLAWSYHFPTRHLLPVAGLIAFSNEMLDLTVDGVALPRPVTHFFEGT